MNTLIRYDTLGTSQVIWYLLNDYCDLLNLQYAGDPVTVINCKIPGSILRTKTVLGRI